MSVTRDPQSERQRLWALLGDLPALDRPIAASQHGQRRGQSCTIETLVLDLNGLEPVPAYFVRPNSAPPPWPVVLYNHAHGGEYEIGKEELIAGRSLLQAPPYAAELAARGIATLCIDHWAFGERRGRSESETFKQMLWEGRVMWGMMVYDSIRAIDYLLTRPDIDPSRIATMGLSMGSTMAWWAAALDTRIKVCIDLCCLTDYQALVAAGGLDLHGVYYYVPSLLKHFTTSSINALIAPRAHLALAANQDPLTPPAGLDKIDRDLREAYRSAGVPDRWRLVRYEGGHLETPAMRAEVLNFLASQL